MPMKLLVQTVDYNSTIELARNLTGSYENPVIFHCYWNGQLSEKHLISIKSCYCFNVKNQTNRRIVLWLENNKPNEFNETILRYAEIRYFDLSLERKNTAMEKPFVYNHTNISYGYSEVVRYLLLYKYGGCWFDLDVFFLRSFDPIFVHFESEVIVYQWEQQNYPNAALFISLVPRSKKMGYNIKYIIQQNRGWVCQEALLTYDTPLDMFVLPCSWFDGGWISNPYNVDFVNFFKNTPDRYSLDTFFNGAFCFHWHNKWNDVIGATSILRQLYNQLDMDT